MIRRRLAGAITRVTFWLDITVAPALPGLVHRFTNQVDRFVERHIWTIDSVLPSLDMAELSFDFKPVNYDLYDVLRNPNPRKES